MTSYCKCETPIFDADHDEGCRRCGCPIDFTPKVLPVQNLEHLGWCREMVDSMKEGGVWGVPRSGLLFVKNGPDSLALIAREPGEPELRAVQDDDFRSIRDHMEAVGISVGDKCHDFEVKLMADRHQY